MKETRKYYTTPSNYKNYKPDHTRFGGIIYQSDFNRKTMSDVIGQIISDMSFDEQCRKNIVNSYSKED